MFKRKYNLLLQPLVWAKYRSIINSDNIEEFSQLKIKKIFKGEERKAREWYLHQIVSQWFKKEEKNLSRTTLDRLQKIIKRSKMNLNEIERHDLLIIEERIFSSERTLKILDTHHKLENGENVNARFKKCDLYLKESVPINIKFGSKKQIWTNKDMMKNIETGILLISNKKFIIESKNSVQNIEFKNIISYIHREYGFEFKMDGKEYLLRIHDQPTLNKTIDLIFRKRAKNVIKKCKNN